MLWNMQSKIICDFLHIADRNPAGIFLCEVHNNPAMNMDIFKHCEWDFG